VSRVEIEAGGRRIVIDHDTELEHVKAAARELWDHTATTPTPAGPAYGFTHERRYTPDASATNNSGWRQPWKPVTAEHQPTHDLEAPPP
jgi:hypothetical protein